MNEEMENLNRETHVFPRGSGTNYHKLGGLKQEQRILVQFCRPETEIKVSALSGGSQKDIFSVSPVFW